MDNSTRHEVILGVDTHLDTHVGAVINHTGQLLATHATPANKAGYRELLHWARSFGIFQRAGIEGTGTYGAGLARLLREEGIEVREINRPNRSKRRLHGKSDPTDAENAARAVLSGEANAIPKQHSGVAEALRTISVARRSAVKARAQAINQLRALLVCAPDDIRARLWTSKPEQCVQSCAGIGPLGDTPLLQTLSTTLRLLAARWLHLTAELRQLDATLDRVTREAAKRLLGQFGVGPYTAATLLAVAGDNPERLHSEAAFAALCGASPLQASSGKTVRHRLNRGGDHAANNALWTIAMVWMRSDPRTRAYVARRSAEGMTSRRSSDA